MRLIIFILRKIKFVLYEARLPERASQYRVDVIGEITVNWSRKRGNESVKHFQIAELQFNDHPGVVEFLLPKSDYFPHVLPRFGKQNSFVLPIKFFRQFLRDITCIRDKTPSKSLFNFINIFLSETFPGAKAMDRILLFKSAVRCSLSP